MVTSSSASETFNEREAFDEREALFRTRADAGLDILVTARLDVGANFLSRHFYDYTGMNASQAIGWGWLNAVNPDDVPGFRKKWCAANAARKPFEHVLRLASADGAYRRFACRLSPVVESDSSSVDSSPDSSIEWFGVCTDINDLCESEQGFRVGFESSAIGQAQTDPTSGRFLRVNRKLCELTGYSESELMAMSFLHLAHPEDREADFAGFQRVLKGEVEEHTVERRLVRKNRQVQWVRMTTTVVRDADRHPTHVLSVVMDISAFKRMEHEVQQHQHCLEREIARRTTELEQSHDRLRLRERMASIGTLAGGIGHDLGNLVLPVLCRLDALLSREIPEDIAREISSIRNVCVHLRKLSSALRMVAMDHDEGGGVAEKTRLQALWPNIEFLLQRTLPKRVSLEAVFDDALPELPMSQHQLTHLLLSLVTNAGESMNRADGKVTVLCQHCADNNTIRLAVLDNGSGMTPEIRRRAIEPFFTTKRRSLSTGLGLCHVHSVCKAIGGSMEIDSVPGQGTTVMLTLPLQGERGNTSDSASTNRVARVTIQDERMARYTKALLEASGYAVIDEESGGMQMEPSLWVTDPASNTQDEISRFLCSQLSQRVILIGNPSWQSDDRAVTIVDGSHRAMRSALRELNQNQERDVVGN